MRTKKFYRSNPVSAQAATRRPRHSAEEFISTVSWPTAFLAFSVLLLCAALLPGVCAQNNAGVAASQPKIGKVDVDFQKAALTPGLWHLMGSVKMTSETYDLDAEDVKITFNQSSGKSGASALRQAVATGSPSKQVVAHIRRPLESQAYIIYSDQAVYVPDLTRPSGGRMDFAGHVKVVTTSGFLAGPSVSTFGSATVLLGAGPDYPQVNIGVGHITLTPAQ